MAGTLVSTMINGDSTEFVCQTGETLLEVLRNRLGLTGSKEGCGTGEGLADGDALHPLQSNFIKHAALQCGICTPGFLIASKALLDRNPNPTDEEIRFALAGNLCRCTGYDKIVRAVRATANELKK